MRCEMLGRSIVFSPKLNHRLLFFAAYMGLSKRAKQGGPSTIFTTVKPKDPS